MPRSLYPSFQCYVRIDWPVRGVGCAVPVGVVATSAIPVLERSKDALVLAPVFGPLQDERLGYVFQCGQRKISRPIQHDPSVMLGEWLVPRQ